MEDGILYNLPNIKRNILNNGVVEQGTLGSHLTHVRCRNETRRDELMPDFGDIGQMLSLEVDGLPIIVELFHSPRPSVKTRRADRKAPGGQDQDYKTG